jgi:hypothetical protein
MTTFATKLRLTRKARVAASLILAIGLAGSLAACSPDVAAKPQSTATVTTTKTEAPTPTTATPSETSTPTVAPKATTPAPTKKPVSPKPIATKKPTAKPTTISTRFSLNPMWETENGDPGGEAWAEVGTVRGLHTATCNRDLREAIEVMVNGPHKVHGAPITVTNTTKTVLVSGKLKATALVVNGQAAARIPDVYWNREGAAPQYTILLSKATWEKAIGGKIYSIKACVIA